MYSALCIVISCHLGSFFLSFNIRYIVTCAQHPAYCILRECECECGEWQNMIWIPDWCNSYHCVLKIQNFKIVEIFFILFSASISIMCVSVYLCYFSSCSISILHSLICSILNAQLDHLECAFTQFCSAEAHLILQSVYGIQNDMNKKQKHRDNDIKTAFIIVYYYYGLLVMGYGIWIKWCIIKKSKFM